MFNEACWLNQRCRPVVPDGRACSSSTSRGSSTKSFTYERCCSCSPVLLPLSAAAAKKLSRRRRSSSYVPADLTRPGVGRSAAPENRCKLEMEHSKTAHFHQGHSYIYMCRIVCNLKQVIAAADARLG